VLKKLVDRALSDTNWRLMSDGISYRLGYLNGRLRAYEREDDLKTLVEQNIRSGKQRKPRENNEKDSLTPETSQNDKIIF